MTENKRFSHKKWYDDRQLFDGDEPFAIVDVYIQAEEICNKLNELHEENDVLKQQLKTKYIVNKQYEELQKVKKENEKLKQFIKELTTKGTGRIDLASGYSYNVSAVLSDYRGDVE